MAAIVTPRYSLPQHAVVAHKAAPPSSPSPRLTSPCRSVSPHRSTSPCTITQVYAMGQQIGWGSCGNVFAATDRSGRRVAIKLVDNNAPAKVRDAEAEIAIMRRLSHKNIVQLINVYRPGGQIAIVMELARGDLLQEISRRGPFLEDEAGHIFSQVLEAVSYMHHKGIVHRDLKPENVLLGEDGDMVAKLTDFGLARDVNTEVLMQPCGSREYVAPEIVCGGVPHTLQCDIWSLGVILYVMLSGFHPFQAAARANNDTDYFHILSTGSLFDGEHWDAISHEAKDFIRSMMVVDPLQRLTISQCLLHPWILKHSC